RHTRFSRDWSSDVCSSDLEASDEPPPQAVSEKIAVNSKAIHMHFALFGHTSGVLEFIAKPCLYLIRRKIVVTHQLLILEKTGYATFEDRRCAHSDLGVGTVFSVVAQSKGIVRVRVVGKARGNRIKPRTHFT